MNLAMLDVMIGLVLMYLLLSLVCSALVEGINQLLNRRGAALHQQLERLMGRQPLEEFCSLPGFGGLSSRGSVRVFERPAQDLAAPAGVLIKSSLFSRWLEPLRLSASFRNFPSYIPGDTFADLAIVWHETYNQSREWCDDHEFGRVMTALGSEFKDDRAEWHKRVEEWFDKAMARTSGRFKSRTNCWFFGVAAVLVFISNADSIRLSNEIYRNPAIQQVLVEQAQVIVASGMEEQQQSGKLRDMMQAFPLLGQRSGPRDRLTWTGYLITVLALMMGADFWFNALQKLIRIRTSLKPEDTQKQTAPAAANAALAPGAVAAAARSIAKSAQASDEVAPDVLQRARLLAQVSQFAYDRADNLPAALREAGYQIDADFNDTRTGTQARLLIHANHYVLSFRGTEVTELTDIQTDLRKRLIPFPQQLKVLSDGLSNGKQNASASANDLIEMLKVQVHEGFATGLGSIWKPLTEALSKVASKPLLITGHSLGGALAVLAAFALRRPEPHFDIIGLYTFGQPRVGNQAFAEACDRMLRPLHWRVVNHRDVVPRLAPRAMDYRHTGRVLYFGADGRASVDPSNWFQLVDRFPIDPRTDWNSQFREFVSDHFMAGYLERLNKA